MSWLRQMSFSWHHAEEQPLGRNELADEWMGAAASLGEPQCKSCWVSSFIFESQ